MLRVAGGVALRRQSLGDQNVLQVLTSACRLAGFGR